METMKLFSHSMRMVVNNIGPAMRVSTPLIAVMILSYFLFGESDATFAQDFDFGEGELDAQFSASAAGSILLQIVASLWVAVAWHRFVLLEETPEGYIPPFNAGLMVAYFLKGLLLFALTFAAMAVLGGGAFILIAIEVLITVLLGAVVAGVMILAVIVISARLSIIMPAAALGQPLTLRQAWDATEGMTLPIVLAYALLLLVLAIGGALVGVLASFTGIFGVILAIVFNAMTTLFGLSFLTTIYGVAVEGREIT